MSYMYNVMYIQRRGGTCIYSTYMYMYIHVHVGTMASKAAVHPKQTALKEKECHLPSTLVLDLVCAVILGRTMLDLIS